MSESKNFSYSEIHMELFELSCEYQTHLLERIEFHYNSIISISEEINQIIPNCDFSLYKDCFWNVESYIEYYSKLVKSTKLSIGEDVGNVKSKHKIFDDSNYHPNRELQYLVVHGLRNTSQHFEERLQEYKNNVNPFLKLSYKGINIRWDIRFGNGGYSHSGERFKKESEKYDIRKLKFQSYILIKKQLFTKSVSLSDIWDDRNEIQKLVNENIKSKNNEINPNVPNSIRNLSLFVEQIDEES